MDLISLLKLVVSRLESLKIPYMLTGGLAVSFWGLPRTTHDIDIVIEAKEEDKNKIINGFKKDPQRIIEFKRKQKKKIFGKEIYIISPEDLILEKLLWYKENESTRHLEDIEGILKISKVNLNYIKKWVKQQSTIEILGELLSKR